MSTMVLRLDSSPLLMLLAPDRMLLLPLATLVLRSGPTRGAGVAAPGAPAAPACFMWVLTQLSSGSVNSRLLQRG